MYRYLDYLPLCLREVREFQALDSALLEVCAQSRHYTEQIYENRLIGSAIDPVLARWEQILRIAALSGETLEFRRARILLRFNEQLPFTLNVLREQLAALCGAGNTNVMVDYRNYRLTVQIRLTAKEYGAEVAALLRRVLPANLIYLVELNFNRHRTLERCTHGELGAFTHELLYSAPLPKDQEEIWNTQAF